MDSTKVADLKERKKISNAKCYVKNTVKARAQAKQDAIEQAKQDAIENNPFRRGRLPIEESDEEAAEWPSICTLADTEPELKRKRPDDEDKTTTLPAAPSCGTAASSVAPHATALFTKKHEKSLVLVAMVEEGMCSTTAKIQKMTGVSRGVAVSIGAEARRFVAQEQDVDMFNVRKIHSQEKALATVSWLSQHLSHFPKSWLVDQFKANGCADINESHSMDKETFCKARKDRAHSLWGRFNSQYRIKERDSMNTLLCVLYHASAVESVMKSVYDYGQQHDDGHARLAHILVVRHEEVFLLFMTAAMHTRLPLDWLMRQGVHTSAFMWLNIKQRSWDECFNEVATRANKKQQTSKKPERISDETIVGMTILSLFWSLCRKRSTAPEPEDLCVYVKPHTLQSCTEGGKSEVTTGSSGDDDWIQKIMAFTATFKAGYRAKRAAVAAAKAAAAVKADAHRYSALPSVVTWLPIFWGSRAVVHCGE